MAGWLERYRKGIAGQPPCDDPWFGEQLALARAGDEEAGRRIGGSCLELALCMALELHAANPSLSVVDTVEEANAALAASIHTFSGTNATEFKEHLRTAIGQRLSSLLTAA